MIDVIYTDEWQDVCNNVIIPLYKKLVWFDNYLDSFNEVMIYNSTDKGYRCDSNFHLFNYTGNDWYPDVIMFQSLPNNRGFFDSKPRLYTLVFKRSWWTKSYSSLDRLICPRCMMVIGTGTCETCNRIKVGQILNKKIKYT